MLYDGNIQRSPTKDNKGSREHKKQKGIGAVHKYPPLFISEQFVIEGIV